MGKNGPSKCWKKRISLLTAMSDRWSLLAGVRVRVRVAAAVRGGPAEDRGAPPPNAPLDEVHGLLLGHQHRQQRLEHGHLLDQLLLDATRH